MTPKELFERLQDWLQSLTWGATSNKIFGDSVFVVVEIPIEQLARFRHPSAFVVDQGYVAHPEHPLIGLQNFSIDIFAENLQDAMTESIVLGSNRVAATSPGAGVLDIFDELISKIFDIETLSSTQISIVEKSTPKPAIMKGNIPLLTRSLSCVARVSLY